MKFDKPKVHRQWTSEETKARINLVNSEISNFCRDLNLLDSVIATLRHRKESIQQKISNKVKYVNQLETQLEEIIVEDVEKMLIEYKDATEPDIADDLRKSSDYFYDNRFSYVPDTNSILYYPYIPLLVTPPLISGSGLPSDIPVDEKDLGV